MQNGDSEQDANAAEPMQRVVMTKKRAMKRLGTMQRRVLMAFADGKPHTPSWVGTQVTSSERLTEIHAKGWSPSLMVGGVFSALLNKKLLRRAGRQGALVFYRLTSLGERVLTEINGGRPVPEAAVVRAGREAVRNAKVRGARKRVSASAVPSKPIVISLKDGDVQNTFAFDVTLLVTPRDGAVPAEVLRMALWQASER